MLYVDTKDLTGTALEELAKQVSVMGVYVCKYLNKNGHSYKERVRIAETIPLYYLDLAKVVQRKLNKLRFFQKNVKKCEDEKTRHQINTRR
jgi:hypothetical protein